MLAYYGPNFSFNNSPSRVAILVPVEIFTHARDDKSANVESNLIYLSYRKIRKRKRERERVRERGLGERGREKIKISERVRVTTAPLMAPFAATEEFSKEVRLLYRRIYLRLRQELSGEQRVMQK